MVNGLLANVFHLSWLQEQAKATAQNTTLKRFKTDLSKGSRFYGPHIHPFVTYTRRGL